MSAPLDETAELVVDFCNTIDVECGTDELASQESYGSWLATRALGDTSTPPSPSGLAGARHLRDVLRSCIARAGCDVCDANAPDARAQGSGDGRGDGIGGDGDTSGDSDGERGDDGQRGGIGGRGAVADIAVGIRISSDGLVELTSHDPLGVIAAAAARLAIEGRFDRLKICPADDCRWAFYDRSRNGSRQWCSMQVCGNRAKVRASRARARAAAT